MGATSNNSSRILALQERRKQIEETLAKRNQELRELCLQEAEITGITPPEMPFEVGETPPTVRRIVGTTFQIPENLVHNSSNKDEMIQSLELQIQLHANLAEAALGLANEQNVSKTIKRQHRNEYQKHKNHCIALQEKLALFKEKQLTEQPKQKKKPRAVEVSKQYSTEVHNTLSTNNNDPLFSADVRQSMRYNKVVKPNSLTLEQNRYSQDYRRPSRMNSEFSYSNQQRYDDLFSGIYGLNLNGYSKYLERRENYNNVSPGYNVNMYTYSHDQIQQTSSYYAPPYSSQHSPQLSQHSKSVYQQNHLQMQNLYYSQRSPQHHSPHQSTHSKHFEYSEQFNYGNVSPQKSHNFTHSIHGTFDYKQNYQTDGFSMNPHQIQPHQQYEHTNVITSGLGGCWRKNERGELVWSTSELNWQKDKRFGSLDRRKNKRVVKVPPNVDHKSATLGGMPSAQDPVLNSVPINTAQVVLRRSSDRQLVRTQSLGSVGAQTLDSVYPSDDTSSCGSENRTHSNTLQKCKKKEWVETALDSPVSNTKSQLSNLKPSPIPHSALSPEEKYFVSNTPPLSNHTPSPISSPVLPKPPLEIPAESHPSPRLPETNAEFFNSPLNNQNFTVVQAGQCKPYHEETKPFEMSDFYKYSTKFKKTLKQDSNASSPDSTNSRNFDKAEQNMNHAYSPKRFYEHSPTSTAGLDNSRGLNANFDNLPSNHIQTGVNRWYEDQQLNNQGNRPEGRITDTLV